MSKKDGTMSVDVYEGEARLDIVDLFHAMNDESKREAAKAIALDHTIIEAVCKAVTASGINFDWSDGDIGFLGFSTGAKSSLIEDARAALLPLMGETERQFISELIQQRDHQGDIANQWRNECWRLQREWDSWNFGGRHPDTSVEYGEKKPRLTGDQVRLQIEDFEDRMLAEGEDGI